MPTKNLTLVNNNSSMENCKSKLKSEFSKAFQFNCSHVIVTQDGIESLHGHDYFLSIKIESDNSESQQETGFSQLKQAASVLTQEFEGKVIVATLCDFAPVETTQTTVKMNLSNFRGAYYEWPRRMCVILEAKQTSAEELARYASLRIIQQLSENYFKHRLVSKFQVTVSEIFQQQQGKYTVRFN